MPNIFSTGNHRTYSDVRNVIKRNRKRTKDLSLLITLLLVGLFIAFGVDIYHNQDGVTRHQQTVKFDEVLTLGLFAVGSLVFAARRLRNRTPDAEAPGRGGEKPATESI